MNENLRNGLTNIFRASLGQSGKLTGGKHALAATNVAKQLIELEVAAENFLTENDVTELRSGLENIFIGAQSFSSNYEGGWHALAGVEAAKQLMKLDNI